MKKLTILTALTVTLALASTAAMAWGYGGGFGSCGFIPLPWCP